MAAPVPDTTVGTGVQRGETAAATTHNLTMPTGCSVGDGLIIQLLTDGSASGVSISGTGTAGGTFGFISGSDLTAASPGSFRVISCPAVTSTAPTLRITTGASVAVEYIAIRIPGGFTLAGTPAAAVAGSSTNPDPPSLAANPSANDTLVLALMSTGNTAGTLTQPTGYTLARTQTGTNKRISMAYKQETAVTTVDPPSFTLVSSGWQTATIALLSAVVVTAPANAAQTQAATSPTVTLAANIAPANAAQAQASTSPAVTIPVAPTNAAQAQAATSPTISIRYTLSPADGLQAQASTSPTVAVFYTIAPNDALQAFAADAPLIFAWAPISAAADGGWYEQDRPAGLWYAIDPAVAVTWGDTDG